MTQAHVRIWNDFIVHLLKNSKPDSSGTGYLVTYDASEYPLSVVLDFKVEINRSFSARIKGNVRGRETSLFSVRIFDYASFYREFSNKYQAAMSYQQQERRG